MSSTEEIPPEKIKKERTEAQKAVLERARLKGIEVGKQLAKERREAKEQAVRDVEEKHRLSKKAQPVVFEPERCCLLNQNQNQT